MGRRENNMNDFGTNDFGNTSHRYRWNPPTFTPEERARAQKFMDDMTDQEAKERGLSDGWARAMKNLHLRSSSQT